MGGGREGQIGKIGREEQREKQCDRALVQTGKQRERQQGRTLVQTVARIRMKMREERT